MRDEPHHARRRDGVTIPSSPRAETAHTTATSTPIKTSPTTAAHTAAVTAATGRVPTTSRRVRRGARVTRGGVEGRSSIDVTRRRSHPSSPGQPSDTGERDVDEVLGDREARGGSGGWRVAHDEDPALLHEREVVDQRALTVDSLSAHARGDRCHVARLDLREVAAYPTGTDAARRGAGQLLEAAAPVRTRQTPSTGPGREVPKIGEVEVPAAVALACQGEHGVGADVHAVVDAARQVDPEERVARVGHGVHETADEFGLVGCESEVLPAERNDPRVIRTAGHPGEGVARQPAARDDPVEAVRDPTRDDSDTTRVLLDLGHGRAQHDRATGGPDLVDECPTHGDVVDDGRARRVQCGHARDVRLDLAQPGRVQPHQAGYAVTRARRSISSRAPTSDSSSATTSLPSSRYATSCSAQNSRSSGTPRRQSVALSDPGW